jgi:hypothetical protein
MLAFLNSADLFAGSILASISEFLRTKNSPLPFMASTWEVVFEITLNFFFFLTMVISSGMGNVEDGAENSVNMFPTMTSITNGIEKP